MSDCFVGSAASSLMSTPAWKPLPSACNTTTWMLRSRPAASSVSASEYQPATGNALTGGLSMVTIATWSRSSRRIMAGSIGSERWSLAGRRRKWNARADAELVAFGVGHRDPTRVVTLPDVDAARTEALETPHFRL